MIFKKIFLLNQDDPILGSRIMAKFQEETWYTLVHDLVAIHAQPVTFC